MTGPPKREDRLTRLKRFWTGRIGRDVPLAPYTTFRIGGPAQFLVIPENVGEVLSLINGCREEGLKWCVIGGGSNVLVADEGFPGVVILIGRELAGIKQSGMAGNGKILVDVEAGCSLARLLKWCQEHRLSGLEFAVGIPGTVGGAVVMNAGAWGQEIKDMLVSLRFIEEGQMIRRSRQELVFEYRNWQRSPEAVVLEATFAFEPGSATKIKEKSRKFLEARRDKQPTGQASSGSFFKNPKEGPAGRLIEEAGLKGKKIGGASISEMHANFIINTGGATAADVVSLMQMTRSRVRERHGVDLEPEVRFLGIYPEAFRDEK